MSFFFFFLIELAVFLSSETTEGVVEAWGRAEDREQAAEEWCRIVRRCVKG